MRVNLEYDFISTKNGQTGYSVVGNGSPLIMLVGYSGNLLHWNSEFIFQLASKFKVYLVDNRLIGLTKSSNEASINGLAQDAIDFIDAMDLDSAIVCGWSMGGVIAQAMALQYPEKIKGISLIASQIIVIPEMIYVIW